MEIHQRNIRLTAFQNLVHLGKGVIKVGVHLTAANEIYHPDTQTTGTVINAPPSAGSPAGVVGGADNIWIALHIVYDLLFIPGMIAHGNHICTGGKDVISLPGHQTVAGGVFPVDHGEVNVIQLFQAAQPLGQELYAALTYHVAYR